MSLRGELENLLKKNNIKPAKIRGQNFLVDEDALDEIVSAAEIKSGETILEIGPGLGFLTGRLAAGAKKVIAVELDTRLFKILQEKFSATKNLELINGDILKFDPAIYFPPLAKGRRGGVGDKSLRRSTTPPYPPLSRGGESLKYKLVANIPYEITSAILQKFLTCALPPEEMVLLVQKEVAERIIELKKRSLLNISVWLYGEPEVVATVPAASFYPEPKVTSAILRIKTKKLSVENRKNNEKALKIAKIGFISPRKKLINNLSAGLAMPKENLSPVFSGLGIGENIRAEELEPNDWLRLEGELKNLI